MIIYIHGFGGSGLGVKATIFRNYFKKKNQKYIAPSLSYVPDLAISTLEELIISYDEKVSLIGSSLGGYYAIYLADKYNLKAVLINPATTPIKTIPRGLQDGYATNFFDLSRFEINQTHLNMLKKYEVKDPKAELYLLMQQKGDDVIDYKIAYEKFKDSKKIVEEGGDHSFRDIERYFQDIENFFV